MSHNITETALIVGLIPCAKRPWRQSVPKSRRQLCSLVLLSSVVLCVFFLLLDSSRLKLDFRKERHRGRLVSSAPWPSGAVVRTSRPGVLVKDLYAFSHSGKKNRYVPQLRPPPKVMKRKLSVSRDNHSVEHWLRQFRVNMSYQLPRGLSPWDLADSWVTPTELLPQSHPQLGAVLRAMSTLPVISADMPENLGGSMLKMVLTLAGGQKVLFKPKWYEPHEVPNGRWPCPGKDRHSAEIAAFHLSRLLGFRKTPLTVGRVLKLSRDVIPAASPELTNYIIDYGERQDRSRKCKWCQTINQTAASSGDDALAGSVSLWIPERVGLSNTKGKKHPWGMNCHDGANDWKNVSNRCTTVLQSSPFKRQPGLLLDIIDGAILNYLINNPDYKLYVGHGDYRHLIVSLDSGKGFANHDEHRDLLIILGPVVHCCMLKAATFHRLLSLSNGILGTVMRKLLKEDPANPLLDNRHYKALDRRLAHVIHNVTQCIDRYGRDRVLMF